MSTYQYTQLLQMLAEVSEELDGQEPACNFSDDQDVVEFEQDFNIFEGRD